MNQRRNSNPLRITVEVVYPDGRRQSSLTHSILPSELRQLMRDGAEQVRVLDSRGEPMTEISRERAVA
jgi:hypothetical protein